MNAFGFVVSVLTVGISILGLGIYPNLFSLVTLLIGLSLIFFWLYRLSSDSDKDSESENRLE